MQEFEQENVKKQMFMRSRIMNADYGAFGAYQGSAIMLKDSAGSPKFSKGDLILTFIGV